MSNGRKGISKVDLGFDLRKGYRVDGRWTVVKKLGQGSFGAVYQVNDGKNEFLDEMALKLESLSAKSQVLKIEVAVLQAMKDEKHVCKLYARGRNNRYSFMVMSLLGPSLADMKKRLPGGKMSLSTTVRITFQCAKAVRDMHACGWLHRDVKPSNFCIGSNPENRRNIFCFDFGLARRFRNKQDRVKDMRDRVGFRGTMRYCSINGHKRMELGRHDDLITLLYMMVEFIKGVLPWHMDRTHETIMNKKITTGTKIYDTLPPSLIPVHEYLYGLHYDDPPKYSVFEEVLLKIAYSMGYTTQPLDWEKGVALKPIPIEDPHNTDGANLKFSGEGDHEDEDISDLPNTNFKD